MAPEIGAKPRLSDIQENNMKITKLLSLALTAALPSLLVSPLALAEDFPTRPITEIVPYPAGGSSDLAGRALANALADHLGVNVVVDNRSGGGGSVGISALARARTDGYTIGVAPIGTIANQPHMHRTPYNTESFDYLCQFYYGPEVLVVKPDSPFNTLNEVIDYAKAHPGKLSFGQPWAGHFAAPGHAQIPAGGGYRADPRSLCRRRPGFDRVDGWTCGSVYGDAEHGYRPQS